MQWVYEIQRRKRVGFFMSNLETKIEFNPRWEKLPEGYSVVWFDDRMWAKYHDTFIRSSPCRFSLRRMCFNHYRDNKGHLWIRKAFFENDLTKVCQLCGVVQRADGQYNTCVGKVKITLR